MAWNDPPSFDYQQLQNAGKKFKHRYVNSVTNLGQQQQQSQFQQQAAILQPASNNQHQPHYQPHNQYDPYHSIQPQQPSSSYQNQTISLDNYALGTNSTSNSVNHQGQMFTMPQTQQPFPPQTQQHQ